MDIVAMPVSSIGMLEMNAGTTAGGKTIKKTCSITGLRGGMGSIQAQMAAFYAFATALAPCLAYPVTRVMVQDKVQLEPDD